MLPSLRSAASSGVKRPHLRIGPVMALFRRPVQRCKFFPSPTPASYLQCSSAALQKRFTSALMRCRPCDCKRAVNPSLYTRTSTGFADKELSILTLAHQPNIGRVTRAKDGLPLCCNATCFARVAHKRDSGPRRSLGPSSFKQPHIRPVDLCRCRVAHLFPASSAFTRE